MAIFQILLQAIVAARQKKCEVFRRLCIMLLHH